MKTAVLNVSLDEKVGPGSVEQKFRTVMACMRLCFRDVSGEIATARYDGPDGAAQEQCAVVQVAVGLASLHSFESALRHISHCLGQDCIAVLYDSGEGKCVGPRADRWPFDAKFFNLPAVRRLQAAA